MSAPRPRPLGPVSAAALLLGVLALVGHVVLSGGGPHSWDRDPLAPGTVTLTAGQHYLVSTAAGPDGPAPADRTPPSAGPVACTYAAPGGPPAGLAVTPVASSSRATHAVAAFTAPVGGTVTVTCAGAVIGRQRVFVDDADDAAWDLPGALLLLAVVALLVGAGTGLGARYARAPRRPAAPDPVAADG